MISVNFADLEMAFEFVSSGIPTEHRAYISIDTGAIFWASDSSDIEDEAPDDLGGSPIATWRYPSKSDLGLGRLLALQFTEERLPNEYGAVQRFFGSRGAYGRFKDLLASHGQLDAWYVFEAEHTEHALREWCEAHKIKAIAETRPEEHGSA